VRLLRSCRLVRPPFAPPQGKQTADSLSRRRMATPGVPCPPLTSCHPPSYPFLSLYCSVYHASASKSSPMYFGIHFIYRQEEEWTEAGWSIPPWPTPLVRNVRHRPRLPHSACWLPRPAAPTHLSGPRVQA